MNKKNRFYLVLAFLLGFIVIWNELRKVSYTDLTKELGLIRWEWLGVAVVCMLIHWGIEAKIIQLLLKRTNPSFSFKNSYRIPLIEHLFNAITPFSTGGQPAQIVALAKSGVDAGVATSVSLMKFVVYQLWIVFNFLLCLVWGFRFLAGNMSRLSLLVLLSFSIHFIVVVGLLLVMYWYPFTQKLANWFFNILGKMNKGAGTQALRERTFQKMDNFYEESRYMKNQPVLMIKASLLTITQLIAYYVVPFFILKAIGVSGVSMIQVIVLHAFIILLISLFPVPGGIGGAEYSFGLLFGIYITSQSKLVLAILLWRMVTYYLGIILGLIALVIKPTKEISN